MNIYIYIYICTYTYKYNTYVYIYITDTYRFLYTNKKKLFFDEILTTNYFFRYFFVFGYFVRFSPCFFTFFFLVLELIRHSAFSLCTIFEPNLNKLIIMIIMINIITIHTYPLK